MDTPKTIALWKEFIELKYHAELLLALSKGELSISIDFGKVAHFEPSLADLLLDNPEDCMKACTIACEQFDDLVPLRFTPRIFNLPKSSKIRIKDIRSKHLNKLVTTEAVIRQCSEVRPKVISSRFECPSCGSEQRILQLEKAIKEPKMCGCGRKGKFRLLHEDKVDCQRIKIEDLVEELSGNEQGRQLNVILTDNLTSLRMDKKNTPGTKVRIVGIIQDAPVTLKTGATSTDKEWVFIANHIEQLSEDYDDIIIEKEDAVKIIQASKSPSLVTDLICSYAPEIEGYEDIKLSILLQMFGAVKKVDDKGRLSKRGDFHILLIGDPSAGKTVLIKYASKISPKCRYTDGPGSTGKGLTATVEKDEFIGGWSVQAGALVLANKGILIVDEIDKMSDEDRRQIHSALESQQVTVDRASIHVTLQSETSMLAAGNPTESRFDSYSPLCDQIELEESLLSRFDLIFFVKDEPNEAKDELIFSRVLNVHKNHGGVCPLFDNMFMKKYIAYARQHIRPELTPEACEQMKSTYLKIRKMSNNGSVAINVRKGEGLIRLSEAAAKLRLSRVVETQDVNIAERVFMASLKQIALDPETGQLDVDRIDSKVTASARNTTHIIQEYLMKADDMTDINDLFEYANQLSISKLLVEKVLDNMRMCGDIFYPKGERAGLIKITK